jgi:hypothetical protein
MIFAIIIKKFLVKNNTILIVIVGVASIIFIPSSKSRWQLFLIHLARGATLAKLGSLCPTHSAVIQSYP